MPRPTTVPPKEKLHTYLAAGLTQQQIREAWEKESNLLVSRSAIAMAIARYGLEGPRKRPRHDDFIPWRVKEEHLRAREARMLRIAARLHHGLPVRKYDEAQFRRWAEQMELANAVVHYEPSRGFLNLARQEGDEKYIRPPKRPTAAA